MLPQIWTWFVIFIWTLMDVIWMLLMKCCNEWCVVLNHYSTVLVCMSRVGWNPSWFSDYRDYGSLSTGIWSLRWLFLYLRSYDLVGSVTLNLYLFLMLNMCPTGSLWCTLLSLVIGSLPCVWELLFISSQVWKLLIQS